MMLNMPQLTIIMLPTIIHNLKNKLEVSYKTLHFFANKLYIITFVFESDLYRTSLKRAVKTYHHRKSFLRVSHSTSRNAVRLYRLKNSPSKGAVPRLNLEQHLNLEHPLYTASADPF